MSENGLVVVEGPRAQEAVRQAVATAKSQDVMAGSAMHLVDPRIQKYRNTQIADGSLEAEIGTTGLRQFGGFVLEEWLNQLQGRRAAWAYREMLDNDPVVGAILFAIEMLARGVNWRVQGGDAQRAEFVESCMHDMSHTWLDFIAEALSMLPYGWSFHEIVYKRRAGEQERTVGDMEGMQYWSTDRQLRGLAADTSEDSSFEVASSEFNDGKIGWRKLSGRAQETLLRWWFNSYSGLEAMEQIDWHGGDHVIPIEKALLFRTTTKRKNPEGRSILRNAWTAFYRMTNIQQIEAIGIERDLAGIPVATPPEGIDLNSPAAREIKAAVEEMVQSIRKDENQGVVLPTAGWKLELLSPTGSRHVDTNEVIRRYEQRITSSVLADFVLLGQDALGSYAMADIKSDIFGIAVNVMLDLMCDVVNKYGIPRLLRLNGMKTEDPPVIEHSSAGRMDLEKMGRFLQSLALAGAQVPFSRELMEELFKEAGLPCVFDGPLLTEFNAQDPNVQRTPNANPALERGGQRASGPQGDARERALPKPGSTNSVSKAEEQTGAMIALYPNGKTARAIAQPDGEQAGDLHLTLAFFGKASDLSPKDLARIEAVVAGWAASCPPMEGEISGYGHFDALDKPCTVALVDQPHLAKKQSRLVSSLTNAGVEPSKDHGFQPHITLGYAHMAPGNITRPVKFKRASLVLAGKRKDFKLEGDPAALSKADGDPSGD